MKDSPIELIAISGADLERARPKLLNGDASAFEAVRRIDPGAKSYPHSAHYLPFMVSYLMVEGV